MEQDRYQCADCGRSGAPEDFEPMVGGLARFSVGDVVTDRECRKCGALAFPVAVVAKQRERAPMERLQVGAVQNHGVAQESGIQIIAPGTDNHDVVALVLLTGDEEYGAQTVRRCAEDIVRACNSHDKMLAAIEGLIAEHDAMPGANPGELAWDDAREAVRGA